MQLPVRFSEKMSAPELVAWQESRVKDLWRVFRIMGEFVDGFDTLSSLSGRVHTKKKNDDRALNR